MRVSDVMVRDLTAVTPDETIENVLKIMSSQLLSGVPVVSEDMRVIGFIGEDDIVKAVVPGYFSLLQSASFLPDINQLFKNLNLIKDKPVSQFMRSPALVVNENANLMHVADLMIKNNVRVIAVVDDFGRLVGVVNRMNILQAVAERGT
ncbi:putative signal transduction protein with CBS domains [Pseudothermotoga thermarum DSM 5069]|uniref:Putative signal transduction protein with CBS domains n=1 Tax=Pseudothermotoga thermarum DSM 5069 TaxID=688269 RepID=F7YUB1_9THEM|nr:putative signal transduction protein with CBS domains [Pseudothermotoga thermarum DSM 5069]